MTRDEALSILKTFRITGDKAHEAFDMAIKALETPPDDNWEGYSKRLWKNAYERGKAEAEQKPETCGDCISREAATDRFDLVQSDDLCMSYDDIMAFLSSLPSVEPERKTGKWMWNNHLGEYECSECGCNPIYERTTPDDSEIDKYRYCRWCGAPMEVDG